MDLDGNCINCSKKCHWTSHRNLPYLIELYTVKETRRTEELRRQFVDANSGLSAADQIIAGLTNQFVEKETELIDKIEFVKDCINKLRDIALQPSFRSKDDYIEQLIEGEESKREKGYQGRVKILRDILKRDHQLDGIIHGEFRGAWISPYKDVMDRVNKHKKNKPKKKAVKKSKWGRILCSIFITVTIHNFKGLSSADVSETRSALGSNRFQNCKGFENENKSKLDGSNVLVQLFLKIIFPIDFIFKCLMIIVVIRTEFRQSVSWSL